MNESDVSRVKKFLDEILPEKELQFIVAEFFAYAFIKHLKLEKAAFFLGREANGKSVLSEIIRALFGKHSFSSFSLTDLMAEHNRALIAHNVCESIVKRQKHRFDRMNLWNTN